MTTITWIAVPTRDRPRSLERCLTSARQWLRRDGGETSLLVGDDARSAELSHSAKRVLASVCADTRRPGYYLGVQQKHRLASRLAHISAVPEEVIRFLFFGVGSDVPSYGGNQNLVHLFTKGGCAAIVDDDICLEVARAGGLQTDREEIRELAGHETVRFFATRPDLLDGLELLEADAVTLLESGLSTDCPPFLNGPTVVAILGVYGDPGASSSVNLLASRDPLTKAAMLESEDSYRLARTVRQIVRHADTIQRVPVRGFLTAAYALNNALPTAPFVPSFRGSDATFGKTLASTRPGYRMCFLPAAVKHDPCEARVYVGDAARWRCCDLIGSLIEEFSRPHRNGLDGVRSIQRLGEYSVGISNFSDEDLLALLNELRRKYLNSVAETLLEILHSEVALPAFYETDLNRQILSIEIALADRGPSLPDDVLPGADERARTAVIRRLLHGWGEGCIGWPALEEAAERRLEREEFSLKRALS